MFTTVRLEFKRKQESIGKKAKKVGVEDQTSMGSYKDRGRACKGVHTK